MENKRQVGGGTGNGSGRGRGSGGATFDHLFGPKDPSSSSSSSASVFGSIFNSPPSSSMVPGRDTGLIGNQGGSGNCHYGNPDNNNIGRNKGQSSGISGRDKRYEAAEPCYFSSSIYYGGQENYSPPTNNSESQHTVKKDSGEDDPNGNNPNSASRGNWWQGSLYY